MVAVAQMGAVVWEGRLGSQGGQGADAGAALPAPL